MARLLRWLAGVAWGAVATLFESFAPTLGLALAIIGALLLRADRTVAISGPLMGFGAAWLWWTSRQPLDGAIPSAVLFGVVPLAMGVVVIIPSVTRSLTRHRPAGH